MGFEGPQRRACECGDPIRPGGEAHLRASIQSEEFYKVATNIKDWEAWNWPGSAASNHRFSKRQERMGLELSDFAVQVAILLSRDTETGHRIAPVWVAI